MEMAQKWSILGQNRQFWSLGAPEAPWLAKVEKMVDHGEMHVGGLLGCPKKQKSEFWYFFNTTSSAKILIWS